MAQVLYEAMLIIDPTLEEDASQQILEDIRTLIKDSDGVIDKEVNWGTRKLSYEIKKKERRDVY